MITVVWPPRPLRQPATGVMFKRTDEDVNDWMTVILAAGQGKRMRSSRPKVLHTLAGRAMILAANKVDLLGRNKSRLTGLKRLAGRKKIPFFPISALKGEGLRPLVRAMAQTLERVEKAGAGGAA